MDEAAGRPGGRVLREGPLLAAWAVFTAVLAALVLVRAEHRAVRRPQLGASSSRLVMRASATSSPERVSG